MHELAPTATPAEIYTALEDSAIDMDDPFTPGFDVGLTAAPVTAWSKPSMR